MNYHWNLSVGKFFTDTDILSLYIHVHYSCALSEDIIFLYIHARYWGWSARNLFLPTGSPLSPDIHFKSRPALACSYPYHTLWLNILYNYKYNAKKRPEVENVKKLGNFGGVDISLLNRAVERFESYMPPNCPLTKIFHTGVDTNFCLVRYQGRGYTWIVMWYVLA